MDGDDDDDDDDPIFTEPDDDDEITTETSSTPTEPTDTVFTTTLDPEPTGIDDGEDGEDGEDGDSGSGRTGSGGKKVSGGGIAGIVVGSVAGVAAIGGLIAWWLKRKRDAPAGQTAQGQPPNQPLPGPTYGHPPPPPAAQYYEAKPPMAHEAPVYTAYDPKHQSVVSAAPTTSTMHPAPPVPEMPGSPTYGHQRMSSGPSPNTVEGMSATHTGPTPELYEIGPSR